MYAYKFTHGSARRFLRYVKESAGVPPKSFGVARYAVCNLNVYERYLALTIRCISAIFHVSMLKHTPSAALMAHLLLHTTCGYVVIPFFPRGLGGISRKGVHEVSKKFIGENVWCG